METDQLDSPSNSSSQTPAKLSRIQLLAENRQNKVLLEAIFDSEPSGLAVLSGQDLVFKKANPAYREYVPDPRQDPVGFPYEEVWPHVAGFSLKPLLLRVLNTGESFRSDRHKRLYKDGRIRYFSLHLSPLQWEGEPAVLKVLWDVTSLEFTQQSAEESAAEALILAEQKHQRAEELSFERARLQALVQSLSDIVFTLDTQQHYLAFYGRSHEQYGLRPEEWIGKTPIEVFGPELGKIHMESGMRALAGESAIYQWMFETLTESAIIQIRLSPIYDEQGAVTGLVAVGRDITESKRIEEELSYSARRLEHSNRELQEFAYVASHDLQEPLRKVTAFGNRLKEKSNDHWDPEALDYLDRMIQATERMQQMIHGLLTLSRVTKKDEAFQPVNLSKTLAAVLSDMEVDIERSGGQVTFEELPVVDADPIQMQQLLQNLVSNAIKYHKKDEPPQVKVFAKIVDKPRFEKGRRYNIGMPARRIELYVEDNGIGFDEMYLERIFQPFQRLHGRSEYEGSGIGLSICKKIVERHHGEITARSKPGEGSTFIVTLPVHQ